MSPIASRIDEFDVIPLAFSDPPLLNAAGVHEPLALRTLVRLRVGRIVAWGEGRGDALPPEVVGAVREVVLGEDVFATNRLDAAVDAVLRRVAPGMDVQARLNSFAPLEVAALDAQGRLLGLPVSEVLGGALRERVDYSAYLFFKWAGHLGEAPDAWGPAMDAAGIVRQADMLIDRYGFRSIKLKAGALPPALEVESLLALATSLPEISTGLQAIRQGDDNLAMSDIFGGNAFLPVLFLGATVISGQAVLPRAGATDIYLTALAALLTLVYVVGLIFRPPRRVLGMGVDSLTVLVLYAVGVAGLFAVASG